MFHLKCTSLTVKKFDEIAKSEDGIWICDICKKKSVDRRSTLLSTSISTNAINTPKPSTASGSANITLSDLNNKLETLLNYQEDLKSEIQHLKINMAEYKETIEGIIEENINTKNENHKLKQKVDNIEKALDNLRQNNLKDNVLIYAIPFNKEENLTEITKIITTNIGVDISDTDIHSIHRMTQESVTDVVPAAIILKFTNQNIKNKILAAKRTTRINTSILNTSPDNAKEYSSIYINEHLTKNNQYIFKKARDLKRAKKIKFA